MTERELIAAFNMCMKTAVYVLEAAENLSPEGRRYMIKELRKQIAEIEVKPPYPVLRRIK
jgi:hypothetical protein